MIKNNVDLFILLNSLEGGGAERIGLELATSLPSSIKRVLVVINSTSTSYYPTEDISIKYLSPPHEYKYYAYLTFPVVLIRYIRQLLHYHPSVVLSILPQDNIANIIFSRVFGYKALISAHGMRSYSASYPIISKILINLEQFLLKHTSSEQIAVSYSVKKDIEDKFATPSEKIHVIYNPLDIDNIVTLSSEPVTDINFDIPTIITVGRLHHVKGQWHLIRAFSELRKKQVCQLIICGEGSEKDYLSNLVTELNIERDVIFLGWRDNPYKYMSKSALFVQSSLSEALPNVLIESLACGCPVVAAKCSGGIEEILGSDSSCGIIIQKMSGIRYQSNEPLDEGEQELLIAMMDSLDSQKFRKISNSCYIQSKKFDLNGNIQKYAELISQYTI